MLPSPVPFIVDASGGEGLVEVLLETFVDFLLLDFAPLDFVLFTLLRLATLLSQSRLLLRVGVAGTLSFFLISLSLRRTEDDRDRDRDLLELLLPPPFPDSRPRDGREVVAVTFRAIMAESPPSSSSLPIATVSFAVLCRY